MLQTHVHPVILFAYTNLHSFLLPFTRQLPCHPFKFTPRISVNQKIEPSKHHHSHGYSYTADILLWFNLTRLTPYASSILRKATENNSKLIITRDRILSLPVELQMHILLYFISSQLYPYTFPRLLRSDFPSYHQTATTYGSDPLSPSPSSFCTRFKIRENIRRPDYQAFPFNNTAENMNCTIHANDLRNYSFPMI
jgi:hypothetical protein